MKKKTYIIPETTIVPLGVRYQILADSFTGVSTDPEDPTVNPDPDKGDDDTRSRSIFGVWDDEE